MSWFQEIAQNPYIDVALLVDGEGRLVATSNPVGSETQRIASMVKAAEVLARGLSAELGRGDMHTLQLSTHAGHLLVMPAGAAHYLIALTGRDAPLELILTYMQRVLNQIDATELALPEPDDWDAAELIEAVTEWLHQGGDSAHRR